MSTWHEAFMALFIPKATLMGLSIGFLNGWWSRRREVRELRDENRRLREWQASQSKAPELGPHRSAKPRECDPCLSPDHLHFDPRAALEAINPDRPPRPAPTSIPSGGRVIE